jgi:PIN domain nuclease of toxin-antitoxin system
MKHYVFDETALYAMFQKEKGGELVHDLFQDVLDKKAKAYISSISIGELYALSFKKKNFNIADKTVKGLLMLPIVIHEPSISDTLMASDLRVNHHLSFSESYAIALAANNKAILICQSKSYASLSLRTVDDLVIRII